MNFCEFDKYATSSYCVIHNENEIKNLGDITKVDETKLKPFNMICGGSPCQDFSVAGKQKGSVWTCKECGHEYNPLTVHWSERGKCPNCNSGNIEKTRSSLLVEYLRVIRANKPNFGIYENVKNIVGRQFKDTTFKLFTDELEEYGYNVYWKVLNAKNYGIPQNRERVYLIFIRKDLDNGKFKFPEPFDNGIRLKDILEDVVDQKYYISEDKTEKIIHVLNKLNNVNEQDNSVQVIDKSYNKPKQIEVANCITAREDRGISTRKSEGTAVLECIGNVNPSNKGMNGNVYNNDGLAPTLTTNKGEGVKVAIPQATKKVYIECEVGGVADLSYPESKISRGRVRGNGKIYHTLTATETGVCRIEQCIVASRGRNPENPSNRTPGSKTEQRLEFNTDGCTNTLTTAQKDNYVFENDMTKIRIRKLTPKECFRLMGFSDKNFEAAHNVGISNSQLYKQAGNSIVVDVLYYIFVELYKAMPYLF